MLSLGVKVFLKLIPVCDGFSSLKRVGPSCLRVQLAAKKNSNKAGSLNLIGKVFIM
jgi:hypothetical protein